MNKYIFFVFCFICVSLVVSCFCLFVLLFDYFGEWVCFLLFYFIFVFCSFFFYLFSSNNRISNLTYMSLYILCSCLVIVIVELHIRYVLNIPNGKLHFHYFSRIPSTVLLGKQIDHLILGCIAVNDLYQSTVVM